MNNWHQYLAEDTMYGSSFFPVHSIVDSVRSGKARDRVKASEQQALTPVAYADEAIRSLFSLKSDRSAD